MKQLSIITFFILSFSSYALAQQQNGAVDFKWDWNSDRKSVTINAQNKDYCDYYVSLYFKNLIGYSARGSYKGKTARASGNTPIVTLIRSGQSASHNGYSYHIFRGNIHDKVNPSFVYALPIQEADSLRLAVGKSPIFESLFAIKSSNDTIYACREGRVCDNKLTDTTPYGSKAKESIIINHKDGSFGEYKRYNKRLIYAGEYVKIGQPIAISTANDKGFRHISFSVYFLDKNKINDNANGIKHSGIIPIFETKNAGKTKLEEKTTYIGTSISDDVIMQDMSKKEQQKFLKLKSK